MDEQALQARITELEHALKESEHRNRELLRALEYVPSGIEIYDADGLAQYLNPAMMKMITVPSAESVIGRFNILTDPFSVETGLKPLYDQAYGGEIVHTDEFAIDMERATGDWGTTTSQIWFRMVLIPVFDLTGGVESVVAIMFETTEARQMAKTLQLVSRRDGIELLAGGVAHDYNNLLSAIITNSEIVREISTESEVQELNDDVLGASEQAVFLTRQLLAYTGRNERTLHTLDLGSLTQGITQVFRNTLLQFGSIHVFCPETPSLAEVDAGQYKQVVMNLLTNAMEALPEQGGLVEIKLSQAELSTAELEAFQFSDSVQPGRWNLLEVSDNGVGMDADTRRRIFEPYFTTKSSGHGLGLAATLGIIWNHGGGVAVTSDLGGGATFQIVLPFSPHTVSQVLSEEVEGRLPEHATVLLVDNSPYVRGSVRALLERVNFTVFETESGTQALERLSSLEKPPDMVLMEIMAPTLNGLDVLQEIRKHHASLPVLLVGSHGEMGQRGVSQDPYASFLQKPFGSTPLLAQIARLLSAHP